MLNPHFVIILVEKTCLSLYGPNMGNRKRFSCGSQIDASSLSPWKRATNEASPIDKAHGNRAVPRNRGWPGMILPTDFWDDLKPVGPEKSVTSTSLWNSTIHWYPHEYPHEYPHDVPLIFPILLVNSPQFLLPSGKHLHNYGKIHFNGYINYFYGHGFNSKLLVYQRKITIYNKLTIYISMGHLYHPRCSMYGIFTYIYPKNDPNVGKYSIHGASIPWQTVSLPEDIAIKCRVPGPGSAAGWHLSRVGGGGELTGQHWAVLNHQNEGIPPKNGLVNMWCPILFVFLTVKHIVFFNMGFQNEAFTHQNWRRNLSKKHPI